MNELQWLAIVLGVAGSGLVALIWLCSFKVGGDFDDAMRERLEGEMHERWE